MRKVCLLAAVGLCLLGHATAQIVPTIVSAPGVTFEANQGQTGKAVAYFARTPRGLVYLTDNSMILPNGQGHPVRFDFVGASKKATWQKQETSSTTYTYLIGRDPKQHIHDAPSYSRIARRQLYPGVDAVFYSAGDHVEYDFVLRAGVDASAIRVRVGGARGVAVGASGDLEVQTETGLIRHRRPVAYQMLASGSKSAVEARWKLVSRNEVAFVLGDHDADREITVDPVLDLTEYVGGSGEEKIVATDGQGAYVGTTTSIDFPGAEFGRKRNKDIFVRSLYTGWPRITFFGGEGDDDVTAAGFNFNREITIVGVTNSRDLPTTSANRSSNVEAWQKNYAGGATDGFVIVTNANFPLVTYVGTEGDDALLSVSSNTSTKVLGGTTTSGKLPDLLAQSTVIGPLGGKDMFVLIGSGSRPSQMALIGGTGDDTLNSVAKGNFTSDVWIAGETSSRDLVSMQPKRPSDAFLMRLSPGPQMSVVQSLLFGGTGSESGRAIALNFAETHIAFAGTTSSTDLPTKQADQTSFGGGESDAFLSVYKTDLSENTFATYLGGSGGEDVGSVLIDRQNTVIVAGSTSSTDLKTKEAFQASYGGGTSDGFLAAYSLRGNLEDATYHGGAGTDRVLQVAEGYTSFVYTFVGETESARLGDAAATTGELSGPSDGMVGVMTRRKLWASEEIDSAKNGRASGRVHVGASASVTITSRNPNLVRVAQSSDGVSAASITLDAASFSQNQGAYYADCFEDSGSATLDVVAPGFAAQTVLVRCHPLTMKLLFAQPIMIGAVSPLFSEFSVPFYAGTVPVNVQPQLASEPQVHISDSDIASVTASTFASGAFVEITPKAVGRAVITLAIPGVTPNTLSFTIEVVNPMTVRSPEMVIPAGLQTTYPVRINRRRPSFVDVTATTSDPSLLLISSKRSELGGASARISSLSPEFYLQSPGRSGDVVMTLSSPGFEPVIQHIRIRPGEAAAGAGDKPLQLHVGQSRNITLSVRGKGGNFEGVQPLPNDKLVFSAAVQDSQIASLLQSEVSLTFTSVTFSLKVLKEGTTRVVLTAPEGIEFPEGSQKTIDVVVTKAAVTMKPIELGKDLVGTMEFTLPFEVTSGTQAQLSVTDPQLCQLSTNAAGPFSSNITVSTIQTGTFYVTGFASSGKCAVTVIVNGFDPVSADVTLRPTGLGWEAESFALEKSQTFASFRIVPFALDPASFIPVAQQRFRQGIQVEIAITSSDPDVLSTNRGGIVVDGIGLVAGTAIKPGQTVLTIAQPSGFATPTRRQHLKVTVPVPESLP